MEGPSDQQLINDLFDTDFLDLLESTEPNISNDPPICWFYGEDEKWYLCCQCNLCSAWTEFPSVIHDCMFDDQLSQFTDNLESARLELNETSGPAQQSLSTDEILADIQEVIKSFDENQDQEIVR